MQIASRPTVSLPSRFSLFHPPPFHSLVAPHFPFSPAAAAAVPFIPFAEYRSNPRNVVSAFAPAHPFTLLPDVSSSSLHPLSLAPLCSLLFPPPSVCVPPPFLVPSRICLPSVFPRLLRFRPSGVRVTFRTLLAEAQIRNYHGGQCATIERGFVEKNENGAKIDSRAPG